MGETAITYEILFEILRKEKNNPELQKLNPNFFKEVIRYIQEKKVMLKNKQAIDDFGASGDLELVNIKRILKELYERRERKIVTMAINKSRTKASIVNTNNMLDVEKAFYNNVLENFNKARNGILFNLINEKIPKLEMKENKKKEQKTKFLRFVSDVDKFVGPQLEEYGPYQSEDMATLPNEIAIILINKKVAEEIKEE